MNSRQGINDIRASRRTVMRGGIALAGAGIAAAALGRQVGAQSGTPVAAGGGLGTLGLQELMITATDTEFQGAPSSLTAGRYLITLTNNAKSDVAAGFLQLPDGVTVDVLGGSAPSGATPESMAPEASPSSGGEAGGPPPWYYTTKMAGGPGAGPGQTARAVIELSEGNWVLWGEDPSAPQKPVAITVSAASPASPAAVTDLAADVTVTETKTSDGFAFKYSGDFQPGSQVIQIVNGSDQPHFFLLMSSPVAITKDQLMQLVQLPDGATPEPSSGLPNPQDFKTAAYGATQSAGVSQWIEVNLTAGTYIVACFVGDPAKGGMPHAAEGMLDVVTVGGASAATPTS